MKYTTLTPSVIALAGMAMATVAEAEAWNAPLILIDKSTPGDKEMHIICDNYSTHKHATRWQLG